MRSVLLVEWGLGKIMADDMGICLMLVNEWVCLA